MKKIIIVLVIVIVILQNPTQLVALDKPQKVEITNKVEFVESLVEIYAAKYNVSKSSLLKTIKNENNTFDFDRQSDLKYKKGNRWGFKEGEREKSYGIAQIHLPDHPDVTYEEATDPEFSVNFMASNFAKGNENWWSGYEK